MEVECLWVPSLVPKRIFSVSQAWWYMSVIPKLGRLGQKDLMFEDSLSNVNSQQPSETLFPNKK